MNHPPSITVNCHVEADTPLRVRVSDSQAGPYATLHVGPLARDVALFVDPATFPARLRELADDLDAKYAAYKAARDHDELVTA